MKGSDLDIMYVIKDVNVYEDINSARLNSAETCVAMEMEETKLGFSRLRLINGTNSTPCSIICDFTSLLGHEQLDLVIHWLAIDINCLECKVNAMSTEPS
jgi:hypothetical protein